jgi:hypothetical protein
MSVAQAAAPDAVPLHSLFRVTPVWAYCPATVPSVVSLMQAVPQVTPEAAGLQAPLPLHPAPVHVPGFATQAGSGVFFATLAQVPAPFTSQRWQAGQEAAAQQTPFTHLPVAHSPPAPQTWPLGLPTQVFEFASQTGVFPEHSLGADEGQQLVGACMMHFRPHVRWPVPHPPLPPTPPPPPRPPRPPLPGAPPLDVRPPNPVAPPVETAPPFEAIPPAPPALMPPVAMLVPPVPLDDAPPLPEAGPPAPAEPATPPVPAGVPPAPPTPTTPPDPLTPAVPSPAPPSSPSPPPSSGRTRPVLHPAIRAAATMSRRSAESFTVFIFPLFHRFKIRFKSAVRTTPRG